jgi:hypothetical protein
MRVACFWVIFAAFPHAAVASSDESKKVRSFLSHDFNVVSVPIWNLTLYICYFSTLSLQFLRLSDNEAPRSLEAIVEANVKLRDCGSAIVCSSAQSVSSLVWTQLVVD